MRDNPLSLLLHVLPPTPTFFNILAFVGICSQWCFVSALTIDLDPSTVSPGQHANLHWTLQSGDDPTAVYQLFVDMEQDMGPRMTLKPEGQATGTMEWFLPNLSNGYVFADSTRLVTDIQQATYSQNSQCGVCDM
jgi:hypothetical protein